MPTPPSRRTYWFLAENVPFSAKPRARSAGSPWVLGTTAPFIEALKRASIKIKNKKADSFFFISTPQAHFVFKK